MVFEVKFERFSDLFYTTKVYSDFNLKLCSAIRVPDVKTETAFDHYEYSLWASWQRS